MNTATVITTDKQAFRERILNLMFEDGFGFDEARGHTAAYAFTIFGNHTPTGVERVRVALNAMDKEGKS